MVRYQLRTVSIQCNRLDAYTYQADAKEHTFVGILKSIFIQNQFFILLLQKKYNNYFLLLTPIIVHFSLYRPTLLIIRTFVYKIELYLSDKILVKCKKIFECRCICFICTKSILHQLVILRPTMPFVLTYAYLWPIYTVNSILLYKVRNVFKITQPICCFFTPPSKKR